MLLAVLSYQWNGSTANFNHIFNELSLLPVTETLQLFLV